MPTHRRVLQRGRELVQGQYISQAEVEGHEVALEQREAELAQARAQLEVARVDLANTTIRAPIDGVVIARSMELGQTVAASLQAPKLFVIANDRAEERIVMIGQAVGEHVEIVSGVKNGERVATSGVDQLVDGIPVTVR